MDLNSVTMRDQQQLTCAQMVCHGEHPGGIWAAIHKEKKPRDLILRLRIPNSNPPQYERNLTRMPIWQENTMKNSRMMMKEPKRLTPDRTQYRGH